MNASGWLVVGSPPAWLMPRLSAAVGDVERHGQAPTMAGVDLSVVACPDVIAVRKETLIAETRSVGRVVLVAADEVAGELADLYLAGLGDVIGPDDDLQRRLAFPRSVPASITIRVADDVIDGALRDFRETRLLLGVREAAREFGLSQRQFERRFLVATGWPARNWLTRTRALLRDHLLGSGLSCRQVAAVVGYGEVRALYTAVKRATGLAPRAWAAARRDDGMPTSLPSE